MFVSLEASVRQHAISFPTYFKSTPVSLRRAGALTHPLQHLYSNLKLFVILLLNLLLTVFTLLLTGRLKEKGGILQLIYTQHNGFEALVSHHSLFVPIKL